MDGPTWAASSAMLDLVHDSIIVRDMDGRIVQWNAAAEALYGWTREEALGRDLDDLLHCRDPGALAGIEAQLLAEGSWEGELGRTTRAGGDVWIDLRWSLQRDRDGEPDCIVETGRDITDKRQAEEASRLTEYRFRNLFEAMAVAFWEVDFTAVGAMLRSLRDQGVADLRAYLMEHRDFVREAMARSIARDVNAKALDLFGARSREEIVGRGTARFWPAESEAVYIESLIATMEKRPHYITETRMLTLQGEPIDVLFTVAWSPESRQSGIVLVGMIDIGDRTRAFEALERSEQRYRDLFNFMPVALWQLDSTRMREMFDGLAGQGITDVQAWVADHPEFLEEAQAALRITEANEETLKLFGASDREALLPLMPGLWFDRATYAAAAHARLSGAHSYSSEATITTIDGRQVDILFSVAFADPEKPRSSNLVGAIDISERKRATVALAQSELKYRNLFHHMPISLWQLDVTGLIAILAGLRAEGIEDLDAYIDAHPEFLPRVMEVMRVEQVNARTVELFGGREPADFVGPITPYWQESPQTLRRSLVARYGGAESHAEETRVRTLDGRVIDVFYTSAFPAALAELGIGLVGVIDIGDRVRAEQMLRQVQADFAHSARVATLGELTASIAHEINQPLAAIMTNGEAAMRWLARPEPDVEEVRMLAQRTVADARRAADIIARIRAMAAHDMPEQALFSINALVTDTFAFLQHELDAHGVKVGLDTVGDLPPVSGDRTQVQQVLVNLAVNAMQALEHAPVDEPRIAVRTLSQDGKVRVEVEDNGPGVPANEIARLFDSFFTTKKSGLGIGLSLSRSIIEAHGGAIGYERGADGARFVFTLPAAVRLEVPAP